MKRIKSGDTVIVIAGRSKGHIGTVKLVSGDTVTVEGANLVKKHVKPNPNVNEQGGIKTTEKPIHISNVAIYNSVAGKADKVGFKYLDNNKKVRYFKSNGELVDIA
ncbi:50S ribosomal protein L24 [Legionella sp. W05-934-2]|jgi:large subunit ribosomal protein L24|uniref:50S ribosomal protein L24 n=1 Tax=Legionella sp. W05-934-2 TaxID=1198649 RepID=UPI00346332AB